MDRATRREYMRKDVSTWPIEVSWSSEKRMYVASTPVIENTFIWADTREHALSSLAEKLSMLRSERTVAAPTETTQVRQLPPERKSSRRPPRGPRTGA